VLLVMRLREFYDKEELSERDCLGVVQGKHVPVDVNTENILTKILDADVLPLSRWAGRVFDAKKLAFDRVKGVAKRGGYDSVFYRDFSEQNPDFMNGVDRTPRHYVIHAILFNSGNL